MNDYRLRLGASISFTLKNFKQRIEEVKKAGFDTIDLDLCSQWRFPRKEKKAYETLEDRFNDVKEAGMKINGVHISFGKYWNISETDEKKRKKIVKKIADIFKLADKYSPYCYVIHPSIEPIIILDRKEKLDAAIKSAVELSGKTKNIVCLETLPRTCLFNTSEEAAKAIDEINKENVKLCIDVNHMLRERSEDAVLALGKRIATTHISDHDYLDERHYMPGKGKIDWNALIGALRAIGYRGVFNYEVGDIPPAEIKENYEKLFSAYNESVKE